MIIEPEHFRYLEHQHGRVSSHAKNFKRWKQAYEDSLAAIYANVAPALPAGARSILDIGSGLGGIDVLLSRHYGGACTVSLLDGDMAPPEVEWSFKPHNDMTLARDFLAKNGVTDVRAILPGRLAESAEGKFDLIVSFSAYPFHIHPGNYLGDLKKVIHEKTVMILEVRRTRRDWLEMMVEAFGIPEVLDRDVKWVRCVFRGKK